MVRSLIAAVTIAASLGMSTAAFAETTPADVHMLDRGIFTEFHGTIKGGPGVNLKCGAGGTTGQVKFADGTSKTDIPTTPGVGGSCNFTTESSRLASKAIVSSCAGRVSIAQASEFHEFAESQRTFASNSESFGKLGSKTITGGITTVSPGSSAATISVTAQ